MKFLLFTILLSSPVLALDICHLSKNNQGAVAEGLAQSINNKGQRDEAFKLMELFKEQGCSALKPYKMNQLTQLSYVEGFDDYPISKANDLFKQFPAVEMVNINIKTQKIPENLFHGLPNLKSVGIVGVIETLPIHLFKQNRNLEWFAIHSDEFIGFTDSQFFRYIPNLEELTVAASSSDVPPMKLSEDFCDTVPSLVHFKRSRRVSKVPRSCYNTHRDWFAHL